ncbi:hypothetical protein [Flavobacterium phage FPSV-S29]|nr:hypothetical protein [Flavobacterium phage FPSV-S29]
MKLKIFKHNSWLENKHPEEIMAIPIEVLNGITKGEPEFVKGTKIKTEFYSDKKDNVVVKQTYTDVLDENGFLVGINMKIEWLDEMGNPALFKTVTNSLPISSASEEIRSRRKKQINYLQEAGIRLGVKQYIDMLFGFYSARVISGKTLNFLNNYIENGSKEFENAIKSETNEQILAILNAKLPDNITVKDSILNQIV